MASAKGTTGEELDHVDAFGNSVTSQERAAKGMATRVKRSRGVEVQAELQQALKDGEVSVEEVQAMDEADARAIFSDMGEISTRGDNHHYPHKQQKAHLPLSPADICSRRAWVAWIFERRVRWR